MSKLPSPTSPEDDRNATSPQVGRGALIGGLIVMLLPAGVPIYLGLQQPEGEGMFLFVLAAIVALINAGIVYTLWRWLRDQTSDSAS
ncbi:hypothetical protein DV096_13785 [Bradymonadaceae bacterium TMQ3]|uniref:Uncharacterized protein n=1 Tax=Lujinxingia sediminis TaxID=2480984 RepID=A0ABY0CU93_9DELT|nr:hypothetical protein [Lujinxingia sediminis]RDV37571.1 hypothetical protein DV096_13785 [Bradymonadaceae bacterium TMQ3]RVU45744.1 hypothetical protein EA187_08235 [Lujinxingia sediminis]TXC75124.1 hypothetical protein FRC91_13660 [Bradymonadales bacterium TMQ1]